MCFNLSRLCSLSLTCQRCSLTVTLHSSSLSCEVHLVFNSHINLKLTVNDMQSKHANIQCNAVSLVWGLLGFASLTNRSYVRVSDLFPRSLHVSCRKTVGNSCSIVRTELWWEGKGSTMSKACQFAFVHNRGGYLSLPPPHHYFPFFLNCKASNLTCLVHLCSCQRRSLTAVLQSCSSLSCEVHIDIQFSH